MNEKTPQHPDQPTDLESRRVFLQRGRIALAALVTPALLVQCKGQDSPDKTLVDFGAVSSFKPETISKQTEGTIAMVARTAQGLIALSPICTHRGCTTDYSSADGTFQCPCHGAVFAMDGAFVLGPASPPLSRYAISLKKGRVLVDTGTLIERSSVKASDFVTV